MRYPILAFISIGNWPNILNCVSPGAGHSVKIEKFQIKSNVLNLKSTLPFAMQTTNLVTVLSRTDCTILPKAKMRNLEFQSSHCYIKVVCCRQKKNELLIVSPMMMPFIFYSWVTCQPSRSEPIRADYLQEQKDFMNPKLALVDCCPLF